MGPKRRVFGAQRVFNLSARTNRFEISAQRVDEFFDASDAEALR
jgi:hypothetical protein